MTTDVAADGPAPILQSPTERADLVARLQAAPDINHARIVPAQREAEYIIPQSLRDELLSALASQAAQPAEADGWVMVPREATPLMVQSGIVAHEECVEDGFGDNKMRDAWDAMIAATPPAPATDAGEVEDAFRAGWDAREMKDSGPSAAGYCDDSYNADLAWSLYDKPLATPPAPNDDLRAALEWYAERVADCRKITPEGDNARQALDLDGGKRARAALKENRRG